MNDLETRMKEGVIAEFNNTFNKKQKEDEERKLKVNDIILQINNNNIHDSSLNLVRKVS